MSAQKVQTKCDDGAEVGNTEVKKKKKMQGNLLGKG